MSPQEIEVIHNEAMDLAFDADRARKKDLNKAKQLFSDAFDKEKQVVDYVKKTKEKDLLSFLVISRSAAWLAKDSGRFLEGKEIAEEALKSADSIPEIKQELDEVLEELNKNV